MIFNIFIQFFFVVLHWLLCLAGSWYFVHWENKPEWIAETGEVFNCRKCFYFWTSIISTVCLFMIFGCQHVYFLIGALVLAVLSTIAIIVNEHKSEMSIEEIEAEMKKQ